MLMANTIRAEIIKIGQEMVKRELVPGTWGNISARLPDASFIAITPSGMDYMTLVPENIVIIDLNGNVIEGKNIPSSEAKLHLAIYNARPDVFAIVHTHSIYASSCAVANQPIPPIVEDLVQVVGGSVDVAPYALPGTQEVADNSVQALGKKFAVLMQNHGVVGVGKNLKEAITVCKIVEKAAQIFINAQILGGAKILNDDDIELMHKFFKEKYGQK